MKTRIKKLQTILLQKNLDGLLVSNFYNILYLTGFKGLAPSEREAWLLITKKNTYLFTDGRYYIKLKAQNSKLKTEYLRGKGVKARLITPEEGLIFHLQKIISDEKIKTIGFEAEDLKFGEYQKLKEKLNKVKLTATEKIVVKMRSVKDSEEIRKIKTACQIGDECLKRIIPTIKIGQTEGEIAFKIEYYFKKKGYEAAFSPIVAIDGNSAVPHYDTKVGFGKVKKNSVILVDLGAKFENYLSDITRMILVNADDAKLKIYHKLLEAQKKTILELDNSRDPKSVDRFCRQLFQEKNLSNYPHSTGHGVGLEVHEYPKISPLSTDAIKKHQIFTIEPGVYFEGKWGMRIEDTVVVGKGGAEVLTKFTKEPTILF